MIKDIVGKNLSRELVRTLIDNTPVAYIILDDQYRIHYINQNFLDLRMLDKDKTIGEVCYNISNAGIHCRQCAVEKALKTNEKAFLSRKDTMPNGMVRFIDDYAIPLSSEGDESRFILEIMVNRTIEMQARERRDASYEEMVSILSTLLVAKDAYTATHSTSVRDIAVRLAYALGLEPRDVFDISIAASLHDIGKVRIPDSIINKPDKLTDEEFAMIKKHPMNSYDMLRDLSSFGNVKNIVRQHHERVDGRGYPDGITSGSISLGAKIVAVADTYDAITSTRSYRNALTHEFALEEIERAAGSQLDEDVVKAFLQMDFSGDINDAHIMDKDAKPVERILEQQSVTSDLTQIKKSEFRRILNEDKFLNEIFESTPCGYVLMDTNRKVYFASKYFLNYMGLKEEDVIDKVCYEAGGIGNSPCQPCAIEQAIESGKVEYMRQEQYTNNGRKIFDLFGMPLKNKDGSVSYVIEVIIDRTEEIQMERKRARDFNTLIEILTELLENQEKADDEKDISENIISLRERLNELLLDNRAQDGASFT